MAIDAWFMTQDTSTRTTSPHSQHKPAPKRVDVVVVGAGLSGLMAARQLKENGLSVHLLEANKRTGGRMVRKATAKGHFIDLGGQWGGQNHHRFKALVDEPGLETYPTHKDGEASLIWGQKRHLASLANNYDKGILFLEASQIGQPEDEIQKAQLTLKRYQEIVESIDRESPWQTPHAVELDRITIRSWLEENSFSQLSSFMLELLSNVGGSGGFDPWDASILHSAWTQAVSPQREYPETWLVKGAAGQVAEILSSELSENTSLNAPVSTIYQD